MSGTSARSAPFTIAATVGMLAKLGVRIFTRAAVSLPSEAT